MHSDAINKFFTVLNRTFIHSLWQGLVLTLLAAVVVLLTRQTRPSVRYNSLCILFFVFVSAVIFTFGLLLSIDVSNANPLVMVSEMPQAYIGSQGSQPARLLQSVGLMLDANAEVIVSVWLFVLVTKLLRMVLELRYAQQLRQKQTRVPRLELTHRLHLLAERVGIRKPVLLVESALVNVPSVIGCLKPVILIPMGLLGNIPASQLEAVLLHELAHIRRNDYLVNLVQRLMESVFFFNPGLLWVSSLMRRERESCCDDIALAFTDNKSDLLNAMISFKEFSMKPRAYTLGLFGSSHQLLQRMTRIVNDKNKLLSLSELIFVIINIIVLGSLLSAFAKPRVLKAARLSSPEYRVEDLTKNTPLIDSLENPDKAGYFSAAQGNQPKVSSLETNPKGVMNVRVNQPDAKIGANELAMEMDTETQFEPIEMTRGQEDIYALQEAVQKKQAEYEHLQMQYQLMQAKYARSVKDGVYQADLLRQEAEIDKHRAELNRLRTGVFPEQPATSGDGLAESASRRAEAARGQANSDRKQIASDRRKFNSDYKQIDSDRQQALSDRAQAEADRRQADSDRKQAEADRRQADSDRRQAGADKRQADKDRRQAEVDRIQADSDRIQAEADRRQAEADLKHVKSHRG